jgi:hypothetical protein
MGRFCIEYFVRIAQSSVDGAISTLQGLVSALPAFYGAVELIDIVKLHLQYSVTMSGAMAGLMKAIAKKIPSNTLIPVLCDLWPRLEKSQKKVCLLRRAWFLILISYDRNMLMGSSLSSTFSNEAFGSLNAPTYRSISVQSFRYSLMALAWK